MVLRNRRLRIALFAFWGSVGILLHLYAVQLEKETTYCTIFDRTPVTVIRANHAIPAGTRLTGDMVHLEVMPRRFTDSDALVARNVHTYMGLTTQSDVAAGEILGLDHVYAPRDASIRSSE